MIKLLVVDDESAITDGIEDSFSYFGFNVFTASNGARALNTFKKERPKIIFLDIKLPDKNGLDLLKEFKEIDPKCIVIMITALDDEDKSIEQKARELGAAEFIHKPFSLNYLRDEVVLGKIKTVLDQGGYMQKPRLLLVYDEKEVPPLLKKYIAARIEAEIDLAFSADEAIKQVKEYKPDVIFLDIRMPGRSGLDILPELKEMCPEARIVLVSAWSSSEVAAKAAEFGVKDYINKPCKPEAVYEQLKLILIGMGKLIIKQYGKT